VLKYEDAPIPSPAPVEILVRVIAAGVNPVDYKIRARAAPSTDEKPAAATILGYDIAGVVTQVGSQVSRFKIGDAVFAYTSLQRGGGYAQFAVVKESEAASKPKSLTFVEAAAVPLASLTAWQALNDVGGMQAGQRVLIHGGSGGVGAFAVQIAHDKGAKVFATASAANQEFLKQIGCDTPIDYTTQKFEDVVKAAGGADIVLESIGGENMKRSFNALRPAGILVSIVGQPDQNLAKEKGVRGASMLVKPNAEQLAQVGALIDAGKIKVTVSATLPLEQAAKAHEMIETGHTRGKIVLRVAEEP
jgi:NADPH:quinone reductase-like Zn-dependent oxidoreductase